ncbi:CLUMA_CG009037, isoform C [Clunio marinus]|uniref:CLUMA_CG009037, isoform C n=1 Tax=Clunio marinus TaxID=568069 RepID=A0A1J1I5K5_9DIPT|nr:CLUMA_CG009037, isoform C [Clunio marinus]
MTHVPPSSYEELSELLGDEDEITQTDDATNTTIVTKRMDDDGFQQIITTKEWVNDKVGKRTTQMVRTYYPMVEDEEEVEENVEEEVIDDEKLAELRANAPPMPPPETEVGKDGKKKKKKQKIEGTADVVREAFEGGYKEITTIKFPDGTQKVQTKMFYDPVDVPKSETKVVEETQTTKSGKKKKVKKVVNVNQEILEEYEDDDGNPVVVSREPFPDGTGHKDITKTKLSNGQYKQTIQIVIYPKEKEIIETTEIIEHEATSIRMNVKETTIKQHRETEETEEKTSSKKTKKKTTKIEKHHAVEQEEQQQQHQVQVQQIQQNQNSDLETKKITKKTIKKGSDEQRAALMARDNSEGVTTVVREKTDKGYREISTTVFSDGSTKTQTREFFDAVEETIDPQQAMEMRDNLAVLASQAPRVNKNADGSISTIVVERIDNGYRQTTTTKKLNGATSVQTREFYDPVEEDESNSYGQKRRVVQSQQKIQGQSNTMKSVKLFG